MTDMRTPIAYQDPEHIAAAEYCLRATGWKLTNYGFLGQDREDTWSYEGGEELSLTEAIKVWYVQQVGHEID